MNVNTIINEPGAYATSFPRQADPATPAKGQSIGTSRSGQGHGPKVEDRIVRTDSDFHRMQNMNAELDQVARHNKDAADSLSRIEDYIDAMKAQLEQIVKTYPPYPPGSEERVRALRGYYGFRHLIDKLTIPPSIMAQLTGVSQEAAHSAPGVHGGNAGTGN